MRPFGSSPVQAAVVITLSVLSVLTWATIIVVIAAACAPIPVSVQPTPPAPSNSAAPSVGPKDATSAPQPSGQISTISPSPVSSPAPSGFPGTQVPASPVPKPSAPQSISPPASPYPSSSVSPAVSPSVSPSVSPPPGSPTRGVISPPIQSLERLISLLRAYGLSLQDVKTGKTVTFAVPPISTSVPCDQKVLMMNSPLVANKPISDTLVVGTLVLNCELDLPDTIVLDHRPSKLPPDSYLVQVNEAQSLIVLLSSQGGAYALHATPRTLKRLVSSPESVITYKDICFAWNMSPGKSYNQYCVPLSPMQNFDKSTQAALVAEMDRAVQALAVGGQLRRADIDTSRTVPDTEGNQSVESQQASLLAAPVARLASNRPDGPTTGDLLGAVDVLLDVQVPGYPTLPRGYYAVRAVEYGKHQLMARFTRQDGWSIDIPAEYLETLGVAPGQAPESVAILRNLCFPWICIWEGRR